MDIELNQNVGISAQWRMEVCTPTPTGLISSYPYGTGFQNNAILNTFLSGIMLHLHKASDPKMFLPARFAQGEMQLGTGLKPITYRDIALDKFYQRSNYIRPIADRIKNEYYPESGMAIFDITYDFPSVPGTVRYTEAGFKQIDSASDFAGFNINPIYSRFLFTKESIMTGYISGIVDESGNFFKFEHPLDQVSGVFVIERSGNSSILLTKSYEINKKNIELEYVTGYISGYLSFDGSFTPFTGENSASGYFLSGNKNLFPPKTEIIYEDVNGYISGNMTELYGFVPFTDPQLASSGYFLSGDQYAFIDPFNEFSGLTGFENGYNYYGFNFLYGSGFVSDIEGEIYGDGKITGIIGNRGVVKENFGEFSGFSGLNGFDKRAGFEFTKFFAFSSGFVQESGQPIFGTLKFGTGSMTGIIGYRNIYYNTYSGLDAIPTHEYGWYFISSGMFGSDTTIINNQYTNPNYWMTGFSGQPISKTELVIGFINGFQNENGEFFPYYIDTIGDNLSGYFFNGEKYFFGTGEGEGHFDSEINFLGLEYNYTGFSFPNGSGFSGFDYANSGNGMMTGYIGDVTVVRPSPTGIGILTGIIGYKKYISPAVLELGQFIKVRYRIAFRVPQYVNITNVTGEGLVYGDFNGSGQMKFVGRMLNVFGDNWEDRLDSLQGNPIYNNSRGNGIWWPATNRIFSNNYTLPRVSLSASMLSGIEAISNNPTFPPLDSNPRFYVITDPGIEQREKEGSPWFMSDPRNKYPFKEYNTLFSFYTGGYQLENLFVFSAEHPNFDADIGGIWFSTTTMSCNSNAGVCSYQRPDSGDACGWLYKFNTPQRKWEDQSIYIRTRFRVEKDQLFEDPYYGRYPQ